MAEDVLIVDNGSGYVKAGYAGANFPAFVFPSIVGRPTLRAEEDVIDNAELIKSVVVGEQASRLRRALEISAPLENGIVRNWGDLELVWRHLFTDLMRIPEGDMKAKKCLLTEAPENPKDNRRRMVETAFEKFGLGHVAVHMQAILTLYGQGLFSGLVVDSGDGVTHLAAVVDGYAFPHLTRRLDIAGRHITAYLTKLLQLRGYAFNRTADFASIAEMKEKLCYVAADPEKERRLALETTVLMETYKLPDGRVIKVGRERFEAPEALFTPALIDKETPGLSELVWDVIQKADPDTRVTLYGSIVLSGGTTMYPGLSTRLESDVQRAYLERVLKGDAARMGKVPIRVHDPPRRKNTVFMGAAVLGSLIADKPQFWMTREAYAEEGAERLIARWEAAGGRISGS